MKKTTPRLVVLLTLSLLGAAARAQQNTVTIDRLPFVCDKPGTYVLRQDLSCPDSGILILSNDVTIDLGGHTLTYGTGKKPNEKTITYNSLQSGNVGHHAIYVTSDPRASMDAPVEVSWNYRFTGVVITNGTVRNGAGGIGFSDAIDVSGTVGCEVRDLVIEIDAPDTSAIIGGRQSKIHDCRIVHKGTHVSNRHATLAVIVSGQGAEVFGNTIVGGPQCGVKALSGSEIHHNDIRHNVTATNGYGVQGYGQKDVRVHHNLIIPTNGRGIHVSEKSSGWEVHHNYVEVREAANREYPKGLDTHGIKMEGCRDAKVHDNVVVSVSTTGGGPTPCNFSVEAGSNNEVTGNVFVAKKVTEKERATAVFLVGGDGAGTTVRDNVFFSNDRMVEVYWEPGNNFTFRNCRFYRLTPDDRITTLYFWNTKPASGLNLVDCVFGDGVDAANVDFPVKNPEDWPADASYTVTATLDLVVRSAAKTYPGADVTIEDAARNAVGRFKTDDDGRLTLELKRFTMHFDAKARTVRKEEFSPYAIEIGPVGEGRHAVNLPLTGSMTLRVDPTKGATPTLDTTPRKTEPAPNLDKIIADAKAAAGPRKPAPRNP